MNHRSVGVFTGYFGPIRVVYRSRPLNTLLTCMSLVVKTVIKNRLTEKSSDLRFVLFKGQASRPYSGMGRHLVLTNFKTISSATVFSNLRVLRGNFQIVQFLIMGYY